MNRKSGSETGYRPSFEGKAHRNANVDTNTEKNEKNAATKVSSDEPHYTKSVRIYPEPPPNYRGMIYDGITDGGGAAEGLDRLVRNDVSYSEYEKNHRKNEHEPSKSVFAATQGGEKCNLKGLEGLVEGLKGKRFSSEDILLCAMILLMLNSGSDDDILMVLVLMMLL